MPYGPLRVKQECVSVRTVKHWPIFVATLVTVTWQNLLFLGYREKGKMIARQIPFC